MVGDEEGHEQSSIEQATQLKDPPPLRGETSHAGESPNFESRQPKLVQEMAVSVPAIHVLAVLNRTLIPLHYGKQLCSAQTEHQSEVSDGFTTD